MRYDIRIRRGRRVLAGLLLALGLLAAGGCSRGPGVGKVSGHVLYRGQALTSGEVHFYARETGIGAIARIDSSGTFQTDTALRAGTYGVYVTPTPPEPGSPPPPPTPVPPRFRDLS